MDKQRDSHLYIHAVGSFGEKTAAVLKELSQDPLAVVLAGNDELLADGWPKADAFVLAAWRPVQQLCRLFERMSYSSLTPFIPIIMDAPHLQVGPVVAPGVGACHTCFEKRHLQHSARREAEHALREFYEAHPDAGPKGYLTPFAEIAAIRLIHFLAKLQADPISVAGMVWRFDTMTRQVVSGRTVGIHGCTRCGLGSEERTRSFALLHREITRFLPIRGIRHEAAFAMVE